jgi:CubicO group peptidase (beta-lactamase class C family)
MRPPGEGVVYSNLGYGLLEYVIERTSGKSYVEFLQHELFAPLGLSESAVNRTPHFGEHVAVRYMGNHAVPFFDFDTRGAAAVFMSAHDMVRFGMYHLQGRLDGQQETVLRRRTLASMLETGLPPIFRTSTKAAIRPPAASTQTDWAPGIRYSSVSGLGYKMSPHIQKSRFAPHRV